MRKAAALIFLLLMMQSVSNAQMSEKDMDLVASYCLGLTRAQAAILSEKRWVGVDLVVERSKKFKMYLEKRGLMGKGDTKLMEQFRSGFSDAQKCATFWDQPGPAECLKRCGGMGGDIQDKCLATCGTEDSCKRAVLCAVDVQ